MDHPHFILDSNIIILFFNNRLADPIPDGNLACSVITEIEALSFEREAALIRRYLCLLYTSRCV